MTRAGDALRRAEQLVRDSRAALADGNWERARAGVQEARAALRLGQLGKRDGELVALADEIDAAEGAHVRGQERDAARRRKQALVRQGEEMLAAVSAAMAAAARRRASAEGAARVWSGGCHDNVVGGKGGLGGTGSVGLGCNVKVLKARLCTAVEGAI